MSKPITKRRAKQNAEADQVFCLIASAGHLWMQGYYDVLPIAVRRRLRESAFNICPACMVTEVMPRVRRQHPNWPREKLLFAAIEVMEAQVRKSGRRDSPRRRVSLPIVKLGGGS